MGFDDGRIIFDNPDGAFYSGTTVSGRLVFQQEKTKKFRDVLSTIAGRIRSETIDHDSYEEYVNVRRYLVGGESGSHKLNPGSYEYPFTFDLPENCPPSFEGSYGHIRYHVKVVVDRDFKFNQEKKAAVRVLNIVDLNIDPHSRVPIQMEFNATYSCCCMGSGSTDTVVNVPVSGFCSGQVVPIEVSCDNKGSVEVDKIKMSLIKVITYIATVNPDTKCKTYNVAKISKGPIPANTTRNYTVEMKIPAVNVYNVDYCRYIDAFYILQVVVSPSGCHSDSESIRKIIIGNVPLEGYVRNPLQDQQVGIVTQQPLPSYSGNSPYPADDGPHPGDPFAAASAPAPPSPDVDKKY